MKQKEFERLKKQNMQVDPQLYDTIVSAGKQVNKHYIFWNVFWHIIIGIIFIGVLYGGLFLARNTIRNEIKQTTTEMATEMKNGIQEGTQKAIDGQTSNKNWDIQQLKQELTNVATQSSGNSEK